MKKIASIKSTVDQASFIHCLKLEMHSDPGHNDGKRMHDSRTPIHGIMYQYCNMINMQPGATSGMLGEPACQKIFRDTCLLTGYKGEKKNKPSDKELMRHHM